MIVVIAMLLGTLAAIGVIRAIIQALFKKFTKSNHWVASNFITTCLRTALAIPQLLGSPYLLLNLLIIFIIYLLEQAVWFVYDFIQSRRNNKPANWWLILGILVGGVLWLLGLRIVTAAASAVIMAG